MSTSYSNAQRGYVLLLALVFLGIFFTTATAYLNSVTISARSMRYNIASAEALALAEAGMDQAAYQLNQNPSYTGEENTPLAGGVFTVAVSPIDASTKLVTATGYVPNSTSPLATKIITAHIGINNSVISFHYGIQAGNGGFELQNTSKIIGNVFSGGPVVGAGGNYVYGDVVSSGDDGWVYGIHATSSVYAHTIGKTGEPTIIDKDAYYAITKVNTTVSGASFPNSPDQPMVALPITDEQIQQWEAYAEAGGLIDVCDNHGDYTVGSSTSLGPIKIACNLIVKSTNETLTVKGPIWVTGNLTTQTSPKIKIDSSLGSQNVAIIADNPANQTGSGIIKIGQGTEFYGSGAPGSFVFLISQNRSAEQEGSTVAIDMGQGASALVAYAAHGLVTLSQSVNVKEATGYKILLKNSATVTYDTGLPNTAFQSGPGGSWNFVPGTYSITR